MGLNIKLKRDLATMLYRRPIEIFETLNGHARLNKWISEFDCPRFADRFQLYKFVSETCVGQDEIDYLEFGVHKGDSFKEWLRLNRNRGSNFFGFDTFTGLPEDWGSYLKRGHFSTEGITPKVDDDRAKFIPGLFQETLPDFLKKFSSERRLVIHNDSDLYSSTLYVLTKMNDLIVPGTIIIFDEFSSPAHEFRAWTDFLQSYLRRVKLIATSGPYAEQAAFMFE